MKVSDLINEINSYHYVINYLSTSIKLPVDVTILIDTLKKMPISLVEVHHDKSSKAKSLHQFFENVIFNFILVYSSFKTRIKFWYVRKRKNIR